MEKCTCHRSKTPQKGPSDGKFSQEFNPAQNIPSYVPVPKSRTLTPSYETGRGIQTPPYETGRGSGTPPAAVDSKLLKNQPAKSGSENPMRLTYVPKFNPPPCTHTGKVGPAPTNTVPAPVGKRENLTGKVGPSQTNTVSAPLAKTENIAAAPKAEVKTQKQSTAKTQKEPTAKIQKQPTANTQKQPTANTQKPPTANTAAACFAKTEHLTAMPRAEVKRPKQRPAVITSETEVMVPKSSVAKNGMTKDENAEVTSIPQTNFAIGLMVLCCFNPPVGLLALYFSLKAAAAYRDGDKKRGASRARISIIVSLVGIMVTMVIVCSLVVHIAVARHSTRVSRRPNTSALGY